MHKFNLQVENKGEEGINMKKRMSFLVFLLIAIAVCMTAVVFASAKHSYGDPPVKGTFVFATNKTGEVT